MKFSHGVYVMTHDKTRIVVGGTFDIIHLGHIKFLWAAKKLAENSELIVIIARDSTVKRLKKREPIFSERERLEIVKNLKPVDKAVLGKNTDNLLDILIDLKPDILALGYDQGFSEAEISRWAKEHGLSLKVVRLPKFEFDGLRSSSEVRARVLKLLRKDEIVERDL